MLEKNKLTLTAWHVKYRMGKRLLHAVPQSLFYYYYATTIIIAFFINACLVYGCTSFLSSHYYLPCFFIQYVI